MKKKVTLNDIEYEVVKDYRDGFEEEAVVERATDYFNDYDYIFGDWAYGKLRLKGFYEDKNPKANKINKYSSLDKYIEENCAYGCKYFVAKKNK